MGCSGLWNRKSCSAGWFVIDLIGCVDVCRKEEEISEFSKIVCPIDRLNGIRAIFASTICLTMMYFLPRRQKMAVDPPRDTRMLKVCSWHGWDKIVGGGARQMLQEPQLRPVVLPARAGPSVGLPSSEELDMELEKARIDLEKAHELAKLRAETERVLETQG